MEFVQDVIYVAISLCITATHTVTLLTYSNLFQLYVYVLSKEC